FGQGANARRAKLGRKGDRGDLFIANAADAAGFEREPEIAVLGRERNAWRRAAREKVMRVVFLNAINGDAQQTACRGHPNTTVARGRNRVRAEVGPGARRFERREAARRIAKDDAAVAIRKPEHAVVIAAE